jgi:predicted PurR-regulated permease PerM
MLAALIGGAAAGVPGALVATPLMGAAKALYLDRRGQLPPRTEPALKRRLRQRVEKAKARVEAITTAIDPRD